MHVCPRRAWLHVSRDGDVRTDVTTALGHVMGKLTTLCDVVSFFFPLTLAELVYDVKGFQNSQQVY